MDLLTKLKKYYQEKPLKDYRIIMQLNGRLLTGAKQVHLYDGLTGIIEQIDEQYRLLFRKSTVEDDIALVLVEVREKSKNPFKIIETLL